MEDLKVFFGLIDTPETFMELVVWFITFCFGCSLVRYVLYSIFWLTSIFSKGDRR